MKKKLVLLILCLTFIQSIILADRAQDKFLEIWNEIHDPGTGYFHPQGFPYYSLETAIVEEVDYGHETPALTLGAWTALEGIYGRYTGDWSYFQQAWEMVINTGVPAYQPNSDEYNPSNPSLYLPTGEAVEAYPLLPGGGVTGTDPLGEELSRTYGQGIFLVHDLFDTENWYNFGTPPVPLLLKTRGDKESVWETIPHPAIDTQTSGGIGSLGYTPLFLIQDTYSPRWEYRTNPGRNFRFILAVWKAFAAYYDQGEPGLPFDFEEYLGQARKLGDYLRYALFDPYFKTIGKDTGEETGGTGYDSAHWLIAHEFHWSGGIEDPWSRRRGSPGIYMEDQNPLGAYILTGSSVFGTRARGEAPGGEVDWENSLSRQLEFYSWLQGEEGFFAPGGTNNWEGRYTPYPEEASFFYGLIYDPREGETSFEDQARGAAALGAYFEATGNSVAGEMLAKWTRAVAAEIHLEEEDWNIPLELEWSGQPGVNLSAVITARGKSLTAASLTAMTLALYGKQTENRELITLAFDLMEAVWLQRDDRGLSLAESRPDYNRFSDPVYIPPGMTGTMGTGGTIQEGADFLSLREKYNQDPFYLTHIAAPVAEGRDPVINYHRFHDQAEAAIAWTALEGLTPLDVTPSPTSVLTPTPTRPPTPAPYITPTPTASYGPTPNPGNATVFIYFDKEIYKVMVNSQWTALVLLDAPSIDVAAYGVEISYDPDFLSPVSIVDGGIGIQPIVNSSATGKINAAGFDVSGKGPGTGLKLLKITWNAGSIPGTALLGILATSMSSENYTEPDLSHRDSEVRVLSRIERFTIVDALRVAQYYVGLAGTSVFPFPREYYDLNHDSILNIIDALMIAQYSVGLLSY